MITNEDEKIRNGRGLYDYTVLQGNASEFT